MIANIIIPRVGQGIAVIWKKAMVPRSPIEHPIKHHLVLWALLSHVIRQRQKGEMPVYSLIRCAFISDLVYLVALLDISKVNWLMIA